MSEYAGLSALTSLEENLKNYNRRLVRRIAEHVGDTESILDFGAGIGTLAAEFRKQTGKTVECLEVDPREQQMVRQRGFVCYGSMEEIGGDFSGVFSSNVLEHIEDDSKILRDLQLLLRRGGVLVLHVPALPKLFNQADQWLGHFRRYQKSELVEKVCRAGFELLECSYCDCLGAIAWHWARPGIASPACLRIYDRFAHPISVLLDQAAFHRWIGKNLFLVARKP